MGATRLSTDRVDHQALFDVGACVAWSKAHLRWDYHVALDCVDVVHNSTDKVENHSLSNERASLGGIEFSGSLGTRSIISLAKALAWSEAPLAPWRVLMETCPVLARMRGIIRDSDMRCIYKRDKRVV